jgi:hypothetical protein
MHSTLKKSEVENVSDEDSSIENFRDVQIENEDKKSTKQNFSFKNPSL